MSKVAVVIESTTTLPEEMAAKYKLPAPPAIIIWGSEEFRDGIDIQPKEFYERLATAKDHPSTSQATPIMFKEAYEPLIAAGKDILTITISSKLSGMYSSAVQAKNMFPDANIEVVDTRTAVLGIVWPLKKTLEAAESGASLAECKSIIEKCVKPIGLLLVPETLEYLHKGGRIGAASKFIGTALKFNPILEVRDGVFEGLEKVRTRKKALNRLIEILVEQIDGRTPVYLCAAHANAPDVASKLLADAEAVIESKGSYITPVSPAIGVHLGPGTVALSFMAGID
jgi:DegV family protein with EDD domain